VDNDDRLGKVQCQDLELNAAIVIANPDETRVVLGSRRDRTGSLLVITCIAWALPIR